MNRLRTLVAAAVCCITVQKAHAWDGTVTAVIVGIDTSGYDMRITGSGPMCGTGTPSWAVMPTSWGNYQASAALATTAFYTGRTVTIYTTQDTNGHCVIGYLAFR